MEALKENSTRDVTTIKVDLRLSVLKLLHTDVMKEAYQVFDSSKIKEVILNGCIAAGITESLRQTCEKNENGVNLNLFSQRKTNNIVDNRLVFKLFVRKLCLITTQIKRSRVSILVSFYTAKYSRASIRFNFFTFTILI